MGRAVAGGKRDDEADGAGPEPGLALSTGAGARHTPHLTPASSLKSRPKPRPAHLTLEAPPPRHQ